MPASIVLAAVLLWRGRGRDAFAFTAAIVACLAVTLFGKLAVHACEAQAAAFDATSPSGHTSLAATFYGSLTLIVAAGRKDWQRALLYAAGTALILLIGVSRIVTEAHTLPDVLLGFAIGGICVAIFRRLRGPPRRLAVSFQTMAIGAPVAVALGMALLLAARHWTAEPSIEATARRLNSLFDLCAAPPAGSWSVSRVPAVAAILQGAPHEDVPLVYPGGEAPPLR